MSIHIGASEGEIADVVVLFGDPIRARLLAEKYLSNAKEVSNVRGACYFTGEYNGKRFTFGTSGMGAGSMGIYSYELFNFYDVKKIIRVGTAGSYSESLNIKDVVIVEESIADSTSFSELNLGSPRTSVSPSLGLNDDLKKVADKLGYTLHSGKAHSTDVFYVRQKFEDIAKSTGTNCVEMESYALFVNAIRTNKQAACLVTITDTLVNNSQERLTPDEREKCCDKALEIVLNLDL